MASITKAHLKITNITDTESSHIPMDSRWKDFGWMMSYKKKQAHQGAKAYKLIINRDDPKDKDSIQSILILKL